MDGIYKQQTKCLHAFSPKSLHVIKISRNECSCFCRYELFESSKTTTAGRENTPQRSVPSYLQMVDYVANGCEMIVIYNVYKYRLAFI